MTLAQTKVNTLDALNDPNFRLYFGGQLVSASGIMMQMVAQGYLVFQLTHSELWLGIIACIAGIPILLMTPFSGVVVERMARRDLLRLTQSCQMLLAFMLAFLTFTERVEIWHIVILAFGLGLTNAFDTPARQTFIREIVGMEKLKSVIALHSILNSSAQFLGPTIAGLVLITWGAAWCFLLNGVSFLAVLFSLFIMKVPYAIPNQRSGSAVEEMKAGFAFARRDDYVTPLLLLLSLVGIFVIPIIYLFPAIADVILHSPEEGYSIVSIAQGFGSVIGALTIIRLANWFGYGKVMILGWVLFSLALLMLALQSQVLWAALSTFMVGVCLFWLVTSLMTKLQMNLPDEFRGRVMSLASLAIMGIHPFGSFMLGGIASLITIPYALVLYAILSGTLSAIVLVKWSHLIKEDRSGAF